MLENIIRLHGDLWSRLSAQRTRLPHALLFVGPSGIGKEDFVHAFARALLCENPGSDGSACENCEACHWFDQDSHPDFRRLRPSALDETVDTDADSSPSSKRASFDITIDQLRSLDDFLRVRGHRGGRRVILISPAEAMNKSTANALLKSLEEPGEGVHFLLVSSRAAELLPTIRSRCQQVQMHLPRQAQAVAFLRDFEIGSADSLLALTGGAPYDARRLAQDGLLPLLRASLEALRQGPELDPCASSQQIEAGLTKSAKGGEVRRIIDWIQRWVHDLALVACNQRPQYFPDEEGRLREIASLVEIKNLFKYNSQLLQFKTVSEHPLNKRLFINDLMASYRAIFGTGGIHVR